jgi:transcriptional regulator with XRE-family HTH domain
LKSEDPIGEVARQFALNLRIAIGDRSLRKAAEDTGVDHSTIQAILQGRSWPDVFTLAKLERGLESDLWPGRLR